LVIRNALEPFLKRIASFPIVLESRFWRQEDIIRPAYGDSASCDY
jgi:hypothetical protein